MTDHKHTPTASEKLESSQAHAKKAFDVTAAVAREVAEVAKSGARSAYTAGRQELEAAAHDLKEAARGRPKRNMTTSPIWPVNATPKSPIGLAK